MGWRENFSPMIGIHPLYTCLRSSDGRILIKRKKVSPFPPHQGCVHPLFAHPQCGDFRISKFNSVISPHSTLPLAVWNSETLGRVINFTFEKSLLCRAPGPCHCFRLLRGQACPHGGIMAKDSVPRAPSPPVPLPGPVPADCTPECG